MDISQIITEEYVVHDPDTPVSKLVGTFDDPSIIGVIVAGDTYEGVITRRQLATSHLQPNQKLGSLTWNVPRLSPDEDVRKVAQLMIDSDSQILPVFENEEISGVVTVDGILTEVLPFLDAATVKDAYTNELVTLTPGDSLGKAINLFREQRFTHLPVIDDRDAVGILSLYDILDVRSRSEMRSQGGDAGGVDPSGGAISSSNASSRRGGYGAREGEIDRMLDLPVRDMMTSPVRTITVDATLDVAVSEMSEVGGSSLVVTENGRPFGIITKTDILDALTWEAEGTRAVQVYGTDLLNDMQQSEIVALIEKFDDRDHGMSILDAKVHLHEHNETRRGQSLLYARVRLYTDNGLYMASGEGFGAKEAIGEARDILERQIRDKKTYAKSKKPRDEEYWEKRFGWILEELK